MTKIKFQCASPVAVEAEWDETVLDALLRTGTPVPFFCRSGICGQCKSTLVSGEVMQVGTAPPILTDRETQAGTVLICRSVAVTDCEIVPLNLPEESAELPWPGEVRVAASGWRTPGLFHVRVALAEGAAVPTFLFHPGQYCHVQASPGDSRALPSRLYPASRPGHPFLDFHLSPRGPEQARAFDDAFGVGSVLRLSKPVGASCLKEGERGPALLVSNAAGLPAMLSMISLLGVRDDRTGVQVLVRGADDGLLEVEAAQAGAEAGIDVRICRDDELRSLLEDAADAATRTPCKTGRRPQAYVKGDASLVRLSREIFYARGLKAWEVHAEILEGAVPSL